MRLFVAIDLDEAARVDGCNHFQAFRRVIMPVMWPGVITTGLFSFLLAYNDFLVASLLLVVQSSVRSPSLGSPREQEQGRRILMRNICLGIESVGPKTRRRSSSVPVLAE